MANFAGGYILTKKGEELQAQAEDGKLTLNLTRFQIGNGNAESMDAYYTRDSLVNPLNNLTITSKEATAIGEQNACILKATLVNNAVESGYMAYEMGLFALDADGNEILFAVSYDGNPSYIASKDDGTEITMNFEFILLISGAEEIKLTIPATAEELAAMAQDKAIAAADSAKKCQELKDAVDMELAKAVKMAKYCGSVETYSELPSSPSLGDVYNIVNADTANNIKAGDNVIWTGSAWDNLSGLVDLSDYYTKEQTKDVITQALEGKIVSATVTNGILEIK